LHKFCLPENFYSLDTDCVLLVGRNQGKYFVNPLQVIKEQQAMVFVTKTIACCSKIF
jgi:hypothetical protein